MSCDLHRRPECARITVADTLIHLECREVKQERRGLKGLPVGPQSIARRFWQNVWKQDKPPDNCNHTNANYIQQPKI